MNLRPSGYEPDELPDCSTPHQLVVSDETAWAGSSVRGVFCHGGGRSSRTGVPRFSGDRVGGRLRSARRGEARDGAAPARSASLRKSCRMRARWWGGREEGPETCAPRCCALEETVAGGRGCAGGGGGRKISGMGARWRWHLPC